MNPGRPRDPRIDEALTQNLIELLAERGPEGFSVDELAERSGVGKAAIYRRYRSRDELVAAGFAAVNEDMPDVSGMPVRDALITLLEWIAGAHASGMTPTWLVGMQQIPQLRESYLCNVVRPRRTALAAVLERGLAEGYLRADVDIEVAMTCLSAPAIHVGMHRSRGYPSGEVSIAEVVDLVLSGLVSPAVLATDS